MLVRPTATPTTSWRRWLAALLVVPTLLAAPVGLRRETAAQPRPDERARNADAPPGIGRPVTISRMPEGLGLGASTSEISARIRARWGTEYAPLLTGWNAAWYPGPLRIVPGRFLQRRCGRAALAPICQGTVVRSATASMIEVVAFRERVFRVSVTLPEAPDYRLQARHMLDALREKYGPPSPGPRWQDGETELLFSEIGPAWPATLQYTDVRGSQELESGVQAFIDAENARIRARSLTTPRGY